MDANVAITAAAVRPAWPVQQEIALNVLRQQQESEKEMVAQLLSGPGQIASQVYNGHGQIVPTGAGAGVDTRM